MFGCNDLYLPGGHIFSFSAVENRDILGPESYSGPGCVNCRITAADNGHLAPDVHVIAEIDLSKELNCTPDAFQIFTIDPESPAFVCTAGYDIDIKVLAELIECNVLAYSGIGLEFNTQGHDIRHFLCDYISGKPIFRNSIAHHTACIGKLFEYRDCIAAFREILSCSKTSGTSADNRDLLGTCYLYFFNLGFVSIISDISFEPVDGHGLIKLSSAALVGTELRTDPSA